MATLTVTTVKADGFENSLSIPVDNFNMAAAYVASTMETLATYEALGFSQSLTREYHLRLMVWTLGDGKNPITVVRSDGQADTYEYKSSAPSV